MGGALADVAALLACPECGLELGIADRALRCGRGHSFDIAKQGYVGLLTGASTRMTGDTAAMLDARSAFQGAGHFAPIARAVTAAADPAARHIDTADSRTATILEIGAGTGYYLTHLLDAAPTARGIALDVAKPAARRCARVHPRAASVLADAWRGLPLRDASVDRVLAVFAPRNPAEVARILRPGGLFLVAAPTPRHLAELVGPLDMVTVDPDKDDRLAAATAGLFEPVDRIVVEYPMALSRADIARVVAMGPSAFHDRPAPETAGFDEVTTVTAAVTVTVFRPL